MNVLFCVSIQYYLTYVVDEIYPTVDEICPSVDVAEVAIVLGSIPASSDSAKSEGRQKKQC
ncbi:MAG: hypothetical protein ACK56I_33165, partial [bacterium]